MATENDRTADSRRRLQVRIRGIVQGVGFRPFIYGLAHRHGLTGFVLNDSQGVLLEVEGSSRALEDFLAALPGEAPGHARIDALEPNWLPPAGYEEFAIHESREGDSPTVLVSPDLAACPDCIREMNDPTDRRHQYPFINCTYCGPRFTIIHHLPYDRPNTSMAAFPMCPSCMAEYHNPLDRRFHAQPTACPDCGPHLQLLDPQGRILAGMNRADGQSAARGAGSRAALEAAVKLLLSGQIVAVKGLGGYHLACDATSETAVQELRRRKVRQDKPFAVMAPDLETIRAWCVTGPIEEELLGSAASPIVLMEVRAAFTQVGIAPSVAPFQNTLGVMLPYTPLHHLLLAAVGRALVMTSGNLSDEPLAYRDDEALARLGSIADAFLIHDREIVIRCDDSVTRVFEGREMVQRRSRGYAPTPLDLAWVVTEPILAVGGELKNTFCLVKGRHAFISHHIGDLENLETLQSFESAINAFISMFDARPRVVAHDLHPGYLSTRHALEREGVKTVGVQHHHAHIASILAEHGREREVLGVAWDGTGYGDDGVLWGGEFLAADLCRYRRLAHLRALPLPGGEQAIRQTWRMALAALYDAEGERIWSRRLPVITRVPASERELWSRLLSGKLPGYRATGAGRMFDAASAILGIREEALYEGQGAIELETVATRWLSQKRPDPGGSGTSSSGFGPQSPIDPYPFHIDRGKLPWEIDLRQLFSALADNREAGVDIGEAAFRFHLSLAGIIVEVCRELAKQTGLEVVALGGGCFQNVLLLELALTDLRAAGLQVLLHSRVPANDGGISLGQAAVAAARLREPGRI